MVDGRITDGVRTRTTVRTTILGTVVVTTTTVTIITIEHGRCTGAFTTADTTITPVMD